MKLGSNCDKIAAAAEDQLPRGCSCGRGVSNRGACAAGKQLLPRRSCNGEQGRWGGGGVAATGEQQRQGAPFAATKGNRLKS